MIKMKKKLSECRIRSEEYSTVDEAQKVLPFSAVVPSNVKGYELVKRVGNVKRNAATYLQKRR